MKYPSTKSYYILRCEEIIPCVGWGRKPSEHSEKNPGEYQALGFAFFFAASIKNRVHFTADAGKVFMSYEKNSKIHLMPLERVSGFPNIQKICKTYYFVYLFIFGKKEKTYAKVDASERIKRIHVPLYHEVKGRFKAGRRGFL